MPVEVRLRVPNMKVRALDDNGYPIDHSSMRFRKVVEVPKIPKPDEMLDLTTQSGRVLQARVVRADWNEDRGLFVLSCQDTSTARSRRTNTARWRAIRNGS